MLASCYAIRCIERLQLTIVYASFAFAHSQQLVLAMLQLSLHYFKMLLNLLLCLATASSKKDYYYCSAFRTKLMLTKGKFNCISKLVFFCCPHQRVGGRSLLSAKKLKQEKKPQSEKLQKGQCEYCKAREYFNCIRKKINTASHILKVYSNLSKGQSPSTQHYALIKRKSYLII